MGPLSRRAIVASVIAVVAAASARTSFAAPQGSPEARSKPTTQAAINEAQGRFRRGLELYEEGNLSAAVAELKRAYEIAPNYRVLYDIAQIDFELQNYPSALTWFEKYLNEGGPNVPETRRAQVEKEMAKLRTRIGTIEIAISVADAEISVDDAPVGKSPLALPVAVSTGRRRVSATKEGYATVTRQLEVAGGDHIRLVLELVSTSAPTAASAAALPAPSLASSAPLAPLGTPPPAPKPSPSSAPIWVGWTATAALGAGAAVLGGLAWRASNHLRNDRDQFGASPTSLSEQGTKVKRLAIASDICTAGAIVAGGISLVLTLSGKPHAGAETAAVEITPSLSSLTVKGAF
jgi:hypothetical protein